MVNLTAAAALTGTAALVAAVFEGSVASEAVTAALGVVRSVRLNVWLPPLNAASGGNVELVSLEVSCTVSMTLVIKFQFPSTALMVMLNEAPAVCATAVPALLFVVPGAAVSPGTNSCTLLNPAGTTVKLELATPGAVPSVAVSVVVSAFRRVVASVLVDWPAEKLTPVV